jgi:ribosomal-protein-alanine N-acetyltransferase
MASTSFSLIPASQNHLSEINVLVQSANFFHRHLDWRPVEGWLGSQPFWLLEAHGEIQAALACPPAPSGMYWIRVFASQALLDPRLHWDLLLQKALTSIPFDQGAKLIALPLENWLIRLLKTSQFEQHEEIVVLEWNYTSAAAPSLPPIQIRPMIIEDVPSIVQIDHVAFEAIWQFSQEDVERAFRTAFYASVAVFEDQIVGYQISTAIHDQAHLARLAVLPSMQNRGIGRLLLNNLFQRVQRTTISNLTVNTQSYNHASLALYKSMGFRPTGERFPLYVFNPNGAFQGN